MGKETLNKIKEIRNNIKECERKAWQLEGSCKIDSNYVSELAIALEDLTNYQTELIQIYEKELEII